MLGHPVVAAMVIDVAPDASDPVIVVWAAAPLYCLRVTAAIGLLVYTTHHDYSSAFEVVLVVGLVHLHDLHLDVFHHYREGL